MKKKQQLTELKGMESADIEKKIGEFQHELMNLRFRHASGQLEQTAQLTNIKRGIARARTVLASRTVTKA